MCGTNRAGKLPRVLSPLAKQNRHKNAPTKYKTTEEILDVGDRVYYPVLAVTFLLCEMVSVGVNYLLRLLAVGNSILNGCTFFVIVPCSNHHERHGMVRIVIFAEYMQRVFESFSAAAVHVAV